MSLVRLILIHTLTLVRKITQVHYSARKKSAAKHDKTLAASGQVLKAAEKRVVKEAAKVRVTLHNAPCKWPCRTHVGFRSLHRASPHVAIH